MQKLLVILGPTASGKSGLGIVLAKKFRGEIISADSRQVYLGMDLGTGKVTKAEQRMVPHHLIDIASPLRQYTADRFVRDAERTVKKVAKKNKIPIVVGGTAFYIYSLIDGLAIPAVKPDRKLRSKLDQLTIEQLFSRLSAKDPRRARQIDKYNRRRLIRALEIIAATGRPVPEAQKLSKYDLLLIGIKKDKEALKNLIENRLRTRLKQGMVAEAKRLRETGLSYKRMEEFGLEYRFLAKYLKNQLSREEMEKQLASAIVAFAKRQMTWFKKDKRIRWVNTALEAEKIVQGFLKS